MSIKISFISLPQIPYRSLELDIAKSGSDSLSNVLRIISKKTNIDFEGKRENYIYILNSTTVIPKNISSTNVNDGDKLSIMPMIYGG